MVDVVQEVVGRLPPLNDGNVCEYEFEGASANVVVWPKVVGVSDESRVGESFNDLRRSVLDK